MDIGLVIMELMDMINVKSCNSSIFYAGTDTSDMWSLKLLTKLLMISGLG